MQHKKISGNMFLLVELLCVLCMMIPVWAQNDSIVSISEVEVTYIANEGMLISSGEKQILIDGLFRGSPYGYQGIPNNLLEKLETAQQPYDQIDLLLVTHLHLDHFHAESAGRHLEYNQNAILLAGQDVVNLLASDFYNFAKIENRIKSVTPAWKERIHLNVANFEIDVLRMRHGGSMNYGLDHVGYIVQFDGVKILHIGDVEVSAEDFLPFKLKEAKVDIAFIPDWFLVYPEGQKIVTEHIAPREIVAIHVQPGNIQKRKTEISKNFPRAIIFEKPLEKTIFKTERK